jgi:cytochrome d ubiquinol oxidase subunit I
MVYGLLTVREGISANAPGEVLAGLIGLWAVYLGLIALDVYLLTKTARAGLHAPENQMISAPAPDYADPGFTEEDAPSDTAGTAPAGRAGRG